MMKSFTFIMQQANCFHALKVREDIFKPRSLVECEFRYYRYYQAQKSPRIS